IDTDRACAASRDRRGRSKGGRERGNNALERVGARRRALREPRRASAATTGRRERRLEDRSGINTGVVGRGDEYRCRRRDGRDERGVRQRGKRLCKRAQVLERAGIATLPDEPKSGGGGRDSVVHRSSLMDGEL